ncbi:hypothetical protein RSAG8_05173, partial [Rhizoctonia solani AG-8 WAC10335]
MLVCPTNLLHRGELTNVTLKTNYTHLDDDEPHDILDVLHSFHMPWPAPTHCRPFGGAHN